MPDRSVIGTKPAFSREPPFDHEIALTPSGDSFVLKSASVLFFREPPLDDEIVLTPSGEASE